MNKKLKPAFKKFMRDNPDVNFIDRSFETFKSTLEPTFKEFSTFSEHEKILLHEYYLARLKYREKQKEKENERVKDEV